MGTQGMTDDDYARKLDEMNRVLNDPDAPMQPASIWRLLAEISEHHLKAGAALPPHVPPAMIASAGVRIWGNGLPSAKASIRPASATNP